MIDTLVLFALDAAEWYDIGKSLAQTKQFEDFKKALPLLEIAEQTGEVSYYKEALYYLERINTDDKRAAQAVAYYIKAYCYCYTCQFNKAYSSLNALDAIEISWHTMEKDTIREYQSKSSEARKEIKQLEKEYLKSLNNSNEGDSNNGCLIFGLIALVLILIGLCVYLFFLSNV